MLGIQIETFNPKELKQTKTVIATIGGYREKISN